MKRKANSKTSIKFKKKKENVEKKILSAEEREKRKTSLYRPPTCEELSELKENEHLYKNNLFRMQIEYLLEEVVLKEKKREQLNQVLRSFNTFLKQVKPQPQPCDISGDCLPPEVELPLPSHIQRAKIKGKFHFLPPTQMKVTGSFLLETICKPNNSVDIAVQIPKECLQRRDHLNFRYLFKRAAYLSWLAYHLKQWEHTERIHFQATQDPYKPVLKIALKGKNLKKFVITVHLSVPAEVFTLSRFSPLKNNIRSSWYNETEENDSEKGTSHYNSSVLSDMLYENHLKLLYTCIKECPAARQAIILFKVWLKQRTFKGTCSFNGFIGSMLVAYLLQKKHIATTLSSYQIFRMIIHSLASTDWTEKGISLCEDETKLTSDFEGHFDVVFVDPSGELNLCANVDRTTYNMIRHQAQLSLEILDKNNSNGFESLFIKQQVFLHSADHFIRLSSLADFQEKISEEHTHDVMEHGGDCSKLVPRLVCGVLEKGFENRVERIIIKPKLSRTWELNSVIEENDELWVGLLLNHEHFDQPLTMGPPADQPQAEDFRKLWGAKSELRRFPDGGINEAVLWKSENKEQSKLVCWQIVQHLLQLHCDISSSSIRYHADDFNSLLKYPVCPGSWNTGCGEEEGLNFTVTFDSLCKQLRGLDDLPLKLHSIDGIDPAFRMTEVVTPRQLREEKTDELAKFSKLKSPKWCPVYNVVIQFESSGEWPDDLDAIQHIKTALIIKLSECVRGSLNLAVAHTPTHLDLLKNGYVFRLHVVHYREMLITQQENLKTLTTVKPLHNSLIHSLQKEHVCYGETVRLAKRWIASQMLSGSFCEELIELIAAHLFLTKQQPPRSSFCGFMRFLWLIGNFAWSTQPLVVNLNNQLNDEEIKAIQSEQVSNMLVATSYDKKGTLWTNAVNTQVLRRLTLLAKSALKYIDTSLNKSGKIVVQPMFRASTGDFNVVIHLHKEHVPLYFMHVDTNARVKTRAPANVRGSPAHLPLADFNPPQLYLEELKEAFSEIAVFFYDKFGGLQIGVLWKPSATQQHPFKILNAKYKQFVKAKGQKKLKNSELLSVVNLQAVVDDLSVIGRGLVQSVQINT